MSKGFSLFTRRSLRVPPRTLRWAALTAALGVIPTLAPQPACSADTPRLFSFDVQLAPICLDGSFPLSIPVPGKPVNATLHVDTDVRGHLHGFVDLGGIGLTLSGKVKHGAAGSHVTFRAVSGRDSIAFAGDVAPGASALTGTATGKGVFARGENPFTVDLSNAVPETATIECSLSQDAKGRFRGTGHVVSCGEDVALAVSGKSTATALSLSLKKSRWFKFAGTGTPGSAPMVLDWTSSGFGGAASGSQLTISEVVAPVALRYPSIASEFETQSAIPTIVPLEGDVGPRGKFTVSPSLPTGIALDPLTGVISGTPTQVKAGTSYTITGSNYAGTTTATLAFSTRIPRAWSFAPETRFLTDGDYRHFLARAEFGIHQLGSGVTNLDRVKSTGYSNYLSQMMVFGKTGPAEAIAAFDLGNPNFPSTTSLARWWTSLLVNTDNPFQERLAFFWADRFAVSADALEAGELHLMVDYVDLYRYEGNGNLRSLLLKMARSGAMLKYLNGNVNKVGATNENFAREFWELFTLGVGNGYTQADIVEASKAWTGWKFVTNPTTGIVTAAFDPNLHDSGVKVVLGQNISPQSTGDDFQAMVDLTIDHRPVAEFIVKVLFEHFAYENPPDSLVADMAAYLRTQNYELAPFLRALFQSEAFFSNTARGSLVKNPVEFAIGFIHATKLALVPSALQTQLQTLGQSPTEPPSVNGWPTGQLWFSGQGMADRSNLLDACVGDVTRQNASGANLANIMPAVNLRGDGQVVDWAAALFGLTLTNEERQKCVDYLNTGSPFDGTSQAQIDDRVRGLLFILAQHPSYQVR